MLNFQEDRFRPLIGVLVAVSALCGIGAVLGADLRLPWPGAQLVMLAPPLLVWLAAGRRPALELGQVELGPVLIPAVAALIALPLWLRLDPAADPQVPLPDWSPALLVLAALGFATVNAALEELAFRGLLQDALREGMPGRTWAPIAIQGLAFGAAHWAGFPSGWWGVALAGSWGIALGYVRHRCGGLLAPWLAHIAADLVIFTLLWMHQ